MDPAGLHGASGGGGLGVSESTRYPWMSITGRPSPYILLEFDKVNSY